MENNELVNPPFNVIITGVTGMVGEGVLQECLQRKEIQNVLVINRRPCGVVHPKLHEIIQKDFFDFSNILDQLGGYDACYFCLGVSSVGKSEPVYYRLTYTLTMKVAEALVSLNPNMIFCYVSGKGTDGTQKGRVMWARVKGKTENDLMKLPFRQVFAFRPGFIKPIKGLKNTHKLYLFINWLFPIGRALSPGAFCTQRELNNAMLQTLKMSESRMIFEGRDIISFGK